MSFSDENRHFEGRLRDQCKVDEEALVEKHERMAESAFRFLRATFFESICP